MPEEHESASSEPLPRTEWCPAARGLVPCEVLMCVLFVPFYFVREMYHLCCPLACCEPAREYAQLDPDATDTADIEAGTDSAAPATDAPPASEPAATDAPPATAEIEIGTEAADVLHESAAAADDAPPASDATGIDAPPETKQ